MYALLYGRGERGLFSKQPANRLALRAEREQKRGDYVMESKHGERRM